MTTLPRTIGVGMAIVMIALPATGWAQSADDKAAADALFTQARALMLESKYAEACPKFAQSQRLDAGLGTLLRLADCYEKLGRMASAWSTFQSAADLAARSKDPREAVARRHASELYLSVPKLVVDVSPGAEAAGLELQRDGERLERSAWGSPLALDPGTHVVVASAPGKKSWTREIATTPGVTRLLVPVLEDANGATAAPTPPSTSPASAPAVPVDGGRDGSSQRTLGIAIAGAGVVGVVLGSVFGLKAKGALDDSNADGHCRPDNHCDAAGKQLRDDFERNATVSTIAFIAGGAALAGGAVVYFTAPSRPPIAVTPARGMVGLVARTEW